MGCAGRGRRRRIIPGKAGSQQEVFCPASHCQGKTTCTRGARLGDEAKYTAQTYPIPGPKGFRRIPALQHGGRNQQLEDGDASERGEMPNSVRILGSKF